MAPRVLLVDDDPDVVDQIRDVLQANGFETTTATTFDGGRQLLEAEPPPDVLIADVRLGQFNGLQLVMRRNPATRAVVISGYWDHTLEEEARRLGAEYLLKPIRNEQLVASVRRAIAAPPRTPQAS